MGNRKALREGSPEYPAACNVFRVYAARVVLLEKPIQSLRFGSGGSASCKALKYSPKVASNR